MTRLSQSVRIAAELRAKLAEVMAMDADDEAIDGTVEGETDLPEQIAYIARQALEAEAYVDAIGGLVEGLRKRQGRLDAKSEKLRSLIAWALSEAGFKKLALPDMTVSLSGSRPPLIVDDVPLTQVPPEFKRVTEAFDKTAIRGAIERGEELSFARLGNASPKLTIRRA